MKLIELKGLGNSAIEKLNNHGIFTPFDLLCFFPYKYIDATKLNCFNLAKDGDSITALGKLLSLENKRAKNISYVKTEFIGENGIKYSAVFFNRPYLAKALRKGNTYCISGRLKHIKNGYEISAPSLITISRLRSVIPIYKKTGVAAAAIERAVGCALAEAHLTGCVDGQVRLSYGLMDIHEAFKQIHFPENLDKLNEARNSLSLENLAGFIKRFYEVKRLSGEGVCRFKGFSYPLKTCLTLAEQFIDFKLSPSQQAAIARITQLMSDPSPMNIMLSGDVGSGKTIVCFFAFALAASNGHQAALMCPTEILARQHYANAVKFFSKLGINVELLISSINTEQRQAAKQNILSGKTKIIIGTHSVFSKDIEFNDLTLVATDEQHRFGVNQRGALENKSGLNPDSIVLSATPIPRTLALVLYGELEVVNLASRPKKATIETRFVGSKINEMYDYILNKAKLGEQTYIVCPRVEENDDYDDDEDNQNEPMSAKKLFKTLKSTPLGAYLGILHGKMKDEQKQAAMNDFASGKTKVLVTTTIIEVGIDVKNATTIIIYNAERYGLSQLHQLRGRIGRGTLNGYCFLLCTIESYEKRLKFFQECNDGFILSQKDLLTRGAGDFLGTKQHGQSLSFSGQPITEQLLIKAKEIASKIELPEHFFNENQTLFFKDLTLN